MADTNNTDAPEHKMSRTERRELKAAFAAMEDGTGEQGEFLEAVREALGLPEGADPKVILKHFPNTDAEKVVQQELAKERDDARAEVAKMKGERDAEKVSSAIQAAISKSGIGQENAADATAILRGVLEVKDGKVVTKAAEGIVPGQTADQFIAGQMYSMRPHYWPRSMGGGAKGAGHTAHGGVDVSAFRNGGTLTAQMAVVARVGEKAVIDSLRRSGIVPPAWLIGGAR